MRRSGHCGAASSVFVLLAILYAVRLARPSALRDDAEGILVVALAAILASICPATSSLSPQHVIWAAALRRSGSRVHEGVVPPFPPVLVLVAAGVSRRPGTRSSTDNHGRAPVGSECSPSPIRNGLPGRCLRGRARVRVRGDGGSTEPGMTPVLRTARRAGGSSVAGDSAPHRAREPATLVGRRRRRSMPGQHHRPNSAARLGRKRHGARGDGHDAELEDGRP